MENVGRKGMARVRDVTPFRTEGVCIFFILLIFLEDYPPFCHSEASCPMATKIGTTWPQHAPQWPWKLQQCSQFTSARLWNLDFFKLWLSVTGTLCHHDHRYCLCCLSHHHHTTSPVSITKGIFGNASFYHYLRVFMTCQWLSFSLMTHLWLSSPPTQPSSMLASLTTNELWRHSFSSS